MSKVKVVLNRAGVASLMKSGEMQAILKEHGAAVQQRAGAGYETSLYVGRNRANVSVRTKSRKAVRDNAKNNTLLKAVHR